MAVEARRIRFRKEPVKKAMKEKGVNQMDLAELIGRSADSIKHAFLEELILPEHLLRITDYLGLRYYDVALTDDVFVPVIRCKDCYAYEHQKGDSYGVCKVWMNNTAEDGYCHQGEPDGNG